MNQQIGNLGHGRRRARASKLQTGLSRMAAAAFVGACLAAGAWPALAQTQEVSRESVLQAAEQEKASLAWIVKNTETQVANLVNQWQQAATLSGASSGWAAEFAQALRAAGPERLLKIQRATSYRAVRGILQGRRSPVVVASGSVEDLGDLSQDLTFTPVNPPCRIFDTRLYGGGVAPVAGTTRNYLVHGTGAQMTAQGGNGAGCTAPKGEPVGIAANFTAVPTVTGHLRVYPFGAALPTVSFLNFVAGVNIANAGIVSTCYLCGSDLSVYNAATTHHIGDVMGYFYPAAIGIGIEMRQGGYDIASHTVPVATGVYPGVFVGSTNGSSTITVESGDEVMWTSSAMVYRSSGANNQVRASVRGCYRETAGGVITVMPIYQSETDFYVASNGAGQQHAVNVSAREPSMAAGTYEFGFCAINGSSFGSALDDYAISATKHQVIKIRR